MKKLTRRQQNLHNEMLFSCLRTGSQKLSLKVGLCWFRRFSKNAQKSCRKRCRESREQKKLKIKEAPVKSQEDLIKNLAWAVENAKAQGGFDMALY